MTETATQSKPRKTAPVLPDNVSFDVADVAPGEEWVKPQIIRKREPKPRSKTQIRLDEKAVELHRAWVKAGKPRNMDDSPKAQFRIDPGQADALMVMLRKTATAGGPVQGKSVRLRKATDKSGLAVVTVAVWDRK